MDNKAATSTGKVKKKHTNLFQVPYSNNLLHRLNARENNNYDRFKTLTLAKMPPSLLLPELEMLKCFPPNFTIQNVDKKNGYMRKFTPDGKVLLSISTDQRSLEIYEFRGVGAMADLLAGQTGECITAADHSQQSLHIRQKAFERMFVLRRSLRLRSGIPGGFLNREFSVFISPEESRFVLVASMGMATTLPNANDISQYPDLYVDCDHSFYNFYLIDLHTDSLADHVSYQYDSIQVSHNHGVSSVGNTVAIFSKYRQCVDLYEVDKSVLKKISTVGVWGPHMREPCELLVSTAPFMPLVSVPLTHLKQRILTFLYRSAVSEENLETRRKKLREFYKNFGIYERMAIAKMQLMDPGIILLRYEQHPTDQSNESELDSQPLKLYVFYRVRSEKVLNVYDGSSYELLHILGDFVDNFRNVRSYQTGHRPSSSGNNVHLQASFNDTISMLADPTQRLNPTLPVSTQSFTTSPYLDYDRYIYDDHQISALERPRISSMENIVFRDRNDERVLFRLILEQNNRYFGPIEDRYAQKTRRELVAFIFHPFEPFVISVQKILVRYVVNFHMYNKATIVSQTL